MISELLKQSIYSIILMNFILQLNIQTWKYCLQDIIFMEQSKDKIHDEFQQFSAVFQKQSKEFKNQQIIQVVKIIFYLLLDYVLFIQIGYDEQQYQLNQQD
ncbi:hypothetical protein pb186bvf_010110 [Paramecium bursaria]